MGFIVLPALNDTQAKARIGYDNIAERATTVTASSENSDFPVENAYDWLPDDFYKPSGSGTVSIEFECSGSETADYFAWYNQDLFDVSGTIKLQYWNGSSYVDASATITVTDNRPRMIFFDAKTSTKWKVVISCSSVFSLGMIAFGQYLGLQRGMYRDWTPPVLADDDDIINSESVGGTFLGRSEIKLGMKTTLQISQASDSWMRGEGRAFLDHAKAKPFFFCHNVADYPYECAVVWTDGKIPQPTHTAYGYMSVTIPIRGRIE